MDKTKKSVIFKYDGSVLYGLRLFPWFCWCSCLLLHYFLRLFFLVYI